MSSLSELPVGATAEVSAVHGERRVRRRLLELGVLPGTSVRVVRRAPLGDPIEIRVRGFSLSIRRDEAAGVEITHVQEPNAHAAAALVPAE